VRINLASIFVEDQDKALAVYTRTLGFREKTNFPVGDFRWLTVVSTEEPDGTELLLEPNNNPLAATYQAALFEQGIAAATFASRDLLAEYARLVRAGVKFTVDPTDVGTADIAVFDDTCGNLIQLAQMHK
jgi:catechol 2,3-dioxygenase-like lactoylglutathione lyase family enzyme